MSPTKRELEDRVDELESLVEDLTERGRQALGYDNAEDASESDQDSSEDDE